MNNETNQNDNQTPSESGLNQNINSTPVNPTPVNPAPVNPTPVNPAPVNPAPVSPTPVNPAPVSPTPVNPAPVNPAPVNPTPVNPTPVNPTPVNPAPVNPTPVNPAPVNPASVNPTPVNPVPVNPAPIEQSNTPEQQIDPSYLIQPVKVTEKKKKKLPLILIIIIVLLIIGGTLAYFMLTNPQKVFNKTIDKVKNEFCNYLDEFDMDKSLTDISLKINSDNKDLEQFTKYKYGFKSGVDSSKKSFESKIYITDDKNKEYSASAFLKNSNFYILLSSYDKLIHLSSTEENDYTNFENFENFENVKNEEMKYLVKAAFNSLKENLNKDNFSKNSTDVKVNNKKVKVTKNSYKLDFKESKRIEKAIIHDLYNDEKASKIIMNMTGMTKEDLKAELENEEYIDSGSIITTYVNIYTNFFGKIVGYSIETKDIIDTSFYQNGNEFEFSFNDGYNPYSIVGVKNGKKMNVVIKDKNKEFATLNFDKYSKDNISFEFDTKDSFETHYTGKVTFNKTIKKNELISKFYIKINDQKNNYEINLDSNKSNISKIVEIDETQAVELTDEEFYKVIQDFITSLNETPLGSLFVGDIRNAELDYSEYEQSVY